MSNDKCKTKYDSAILVVLYGKEIQQSSTISSLINASFKLDNTCLVIWNNGPNELSEQTLNAISGKGYDVILNQTLENSSLAAIYNQFLTKVTSLKYIIFDDDSAITYDYLTSVASASIDSLCVPMISDNHTVQSPLVNGSVVTKPITLTRRDSVLAVGSGLVLGSELIRTLNDKYGSVFDERFVLYGVDTTFCDRVNGLVLDGKIRVIKGFNHSFSRLTNEGRAKNNFRIKERAYATALRIRFYLPLSVGLKSIVLLIWERIKEIVMLKPKSKSIRFLLYALISGKHYRYSKKKR